MTAAEHLALIEAVIEKRLRGDAYESYTEAQAQFRGTPLEKLYEIRADLLAEQQAEAAGATYGPSFFLAEPFDA